ncbi:MAG: hypothetical protein INR65_00105 [Gluconacetobacter diazotrophicus]|nr:hypothetical protein [Gluconacetobacter diazotrophicus]
MLTSDRPLSGIDRRHGRCPGSAGTVLFALAATLAATLAGCAPPPPSSSDYVPFTLLSADPAAPTLLSCGGGSAAGGLTLRAWRDPSGSGVVVAPDGQAPQTLHPSRDPKTHLVQNDNYALGDDHGHVSLIVVDSARVLGCGVGVTGAHA